MQGPEPRIVYLPRPGARSKAEREALAQVYRFVLDRQTKGEAAEAESEPDHPNSEQHRGVSL